jgi:hypothetical protein
MKGLTGALVCEEGSRRAGEEEAGGARRRRSISGFQVEERGSGFVVEGRFTFFQQKQNITVNNSLYFVIIITRKNL